MSENWCCAYCGSQNHSRRTICWHCNRAQSEQITPASSTSDTKTHKSLSLKITNRNAIIAVSASVVLFVALLAIFTFRQRSVTSVFVETPAKPPAHFVPVDPNSPVPPIDIYGYYSDYNYEDGWTSGRVILYYMNSLDKSVPPEKFVIKYGGRVEIKEGRTYAATLFVAENQQGHASVYSEPDCTVTLNPLNGRLIPPGLPFHVGVTHDQCPGQMGYRGMLGVTFYFRFPHAATPSRLFIRTEPYGFLQLDLANSKQIYNLRPQNVRPISDLPNEFKLLSNANLDLTISKACGVSRGNGMYLDYTVNNRELLDDKQFRLESETFTPYGSVRFIEGNDMVRDIVYGGLGYQISTSGINDSLDNQFTDLASSHTMQTIGPGETYDGRLNLALMTDERMVPPDYLIFLSEDSAYRAYELSCR